MYLLCNQKSGFKQTNKQKNKKKSRKNKYHCKINRLFSSSRKPIKINVIIIKIIFRGYTAVSCYDHRWSRLPRRRWNEYRRYCHRERQKRHNQRLSIGRLRNRLPPYNGRTPRRTSVNRAFHCYCNITVVTDPPGTKSGAVDGGSCVRPSAYFRARAFPRRKPDDERAPVYAARVYFVRARVAAATTGTNACKMRTGSCRVPTCVPCRKTIGEVDLPTSAGRRPGLARPSSKHGR